MSLTKRKRLKRILPCPEATFLSSTGIDSSDKLLLIIFFMPTLVTDEFKVVVTGN